MQRPLLPVSEQDSHWPEQTASQQTPSTHMPLAQKASWPWTQASPLALSGRQILVVGSQYWPVPQGWAALQPPAQWVVSAHRFDAQGIAVTVVQAPAPSQVDAILAMPAVQLAGVHCFSERGYWQARASLPLQTAAQLPWPGQRVRTVPRWGPAMVTHLPSWFGSAQAWHWPVHTDSQQTPSTQLPN
jgi:hypothetical protein